MKVKGKKVTKKSKKTEVKSANMDYMSAARVVQKPYFFSTSIPKSCTRKAL